MNKTIAREDKSSAKIDFCFSSEPIIGPTFSTLLSSTDPNFSFSFGFSEFIFS